MDSDDSVVAEMCVGGKLLPLVVCQEKSALKCRKIERLAWENLRAAIALHFAYYNFCGVHQSLRVTPAMEAGLTDHIWSLEELVG